jgi:triosephosphate isomerase
VKILIVANWKCNPAALKGAKLLFDSVKNGIKNVKNIEVVICPPFVYLANLGLTTYNLRLGAQDVFWEEKGAYTGEISPLMLKDLGLKYVILGHSERRALGETDEMVNKKLKAALKTKLKPILCVGETEKERKLGQTFRVLKIQLKKALNRLIAQSLNRLLITYEPVWAIGTGKACGIKEAKPANLFIKKLVKNIPILYGGSVNSQNAKDYIEKAGFQGLLVGGASLNAQEFIKIIRNAT